MQSNQGRDIDGLLDEVSLEDLQEAADAMWLEIRRHPLSSECRCPIMEGIARLQELGYVIKKGTQPDSPCSNRA